MPCVEVYDFFLIGIDHVLCAAALLPSLVLEYQSCEGLRELAEEVETFAGADGAKLCQEVLVAERIFLVSSTGDDLHIDLSVDNVELVFNCFDRCVFAHIRLVKPLNLYDQYK